MQYVVILHIPTGHYVNSMEHPDAVYFTSAKYTNSSFSTDLEYFLDDQPRKFLLGSEDLESAFYFLDYVYGFDRQEFELIYRGSLPCVKYQISKHLKKQS